MALPGLEASFDDIFGVQRRPSQQCAGDDTLAFLDHDLFAQIAADFATFDEVLNVTDPAPAPAQVPVEPPVVVKPKEDDGLCV
jgi:hypothetical protein